MLSQLLLAAAVSSFSSNTPDEPITKADKQNISTEVGDLTGYYTCRGLEASGKAYSGIASITKKNDVYCIQWVVGVGSTFTGVGVRQGNNLAASWTLTTDKGVVRGVNLYRIDTGPRLSGRWATLPGPGVTQTETLTFLKNIEPDEEE